MARAPWILLAVVVAAQCGLAAWAEEPAPKKPPVVEYFGGSRSSADWVELPGGLRVGVDKGAAWQGVKVYLSLTWQLVAVDEKTGKTLWGSSVGAYWNAFTFKEITPKDGKKVWAVELRPGPRWRSDAHMRQYHDLRTGKKLEIPGMKQTPSGTRFEPSATWAGDKSDIAEKYRLVLTTMKSWMALHERMFEGFDSLKYGAVDFDKEVVFAISSGNSSNCSGFSVKEAYEDEDRILLRIERSSFQSMNGYQKTRPYGFFVLPRRAKAYEVEINAQGLIGGPPIWKQIYKTGRLPAPETELAELPPKSDKPHHGWADEGLEGFRPAPPPPKRPK